MIMTTIAPVIKNKCDNLAGSKKYRPIAIATIVSQYRVLFNIYTKKIN